MQIHKLKSAVFKSEFGIECARLSGASDQALYPTFGKIAVGEGTRAHHHFEAEIFYIVRGGGRMTIGTETRAVETGSLVCIPPFAEHQLHNTSCEELEFISIYSEDTQAIELPKDVFLTAAPPTPNGSLHLGHIGGPYLALDIVSRYLRQSEVKVRSHCGTDDSQNYVWTQAIAEGISVENFRRVMRKRIIKSFAKANIEIDEFIEPKLDADYQNQIAHQIKSALAKGVLQKERLPMPYCHQCRQWLMDATLKGRCPICMSDSQGCCEQCGAVVMPPELLHLDCSVCNDPAEMKETTVFTFDLHEHLQKILPNLESWQLSPRVKSMVESVLNRKSCKVKLNAALFSECGLDWPSEPGEKIHVWFEMALHYQFLSLGKKFWAHSFGFDNSFYYVLFIPAFLRAMQDDAKLPDAMWINEFWLLEDEKFSTSRKHAIWADEFVGNTDALRLYLSLYRPEGSQSNFRMAEFLHFARSLEIQLDRLSDRLKNAKASTEKSAVDNGNLEATRFRKEMRRFLDPKQPQLRSAARQLLLFIDRLIEMPTDKICFAKVNAELLVALHSFLPNFAERLSQALKVQNDFAQI